MMHVLKQIAYYFESEVNRIILEEIFYDNQYSLMQLLSSRLHDVCILSPAVYHKDTFHVHCIAHHWRFSTGTSILFLTLISSSGQRQHDKLSRTASRPATPPFLLHLSLSKYLSTTRIRGLAPPKQSVIVSWSIFPYIDTIRTRLQ